ncbi:CDP-diacylglycerol--glycerol-3-phosphate 3-phosphatidyltransferase [Paenibacillus sp. N3/727]|uniref:CDP-diacylglycerol--glycerol-3-phosphate 3-phosphatidyltransferase n=1 Tax=Paenibacillus sp. N3/727 TaxID=2925845 RepID=UPI001F52CDB9|nr:CDP-diacylglycerol--glycerol-3-phosphate 3-phosphatidyltransferase [Paenibacillus sp. N3/727]UNK16884.1 CDP-diacylglycerol--glycerol-3-phosphate 3-phosphatidyltransferase [Paenibacillus sp. N3/727]
MNLANKITISRILLIPFFMLFFVQYPSWLTDRLSFFQFVNQNGVYIAAVLFVVASATDKLDGYIARKYNQITNLGKLLDPLADKLLISVALVMMVQQELISTWVAVVIIGREFVITGLRMVAAAQKIALSADQYGKFKMVLQVMGITAVLLGNVPFSFFTTIPIDYVIMMLAVVMTIYSGFNYIVRNYKELKLIGDQ